MKKLIYSILAITVFCCVWSCRIDKPVADYAARQEAFIDKIEDGVAVIFASDRRGALNKDFYYLTGLDDLSMILVIAPDTEERIVLFADNDAENSVPLSEFALRTGQLADQSDILWVSAGERLRLAEHLGRELVGFDIRTPDIIFYQMREIKDEAEVNLLTDAINITSEAYMYILEALEPGMTEQAVIDMIKEKQVELGAESTSHIQAGSGVNGTEIHATPSEKIIEDGDLVVFDIGCWYNNYTSDISRTIPAGGVFGKEQKEIYQLVLDAQKAGIEKMVPGQIMRDVQHVVEKVLIEGLSEMGLITDAGSQWQHRLYIVHGYYHYIGLDIHDEYSLMIREVDSKPYEAGMVMTIEPGLYFPPGLLDRKPGREGEVSDEEWKIFVEATRDIYMKYVNNGVRIEDDILITADGNRVLSSTVPKEIREIEELMRR